MTINAGVWIDHEQAIVVLLTDQGEEMLQIRSDSNASARSPAGLRAKNSYQPNDFAFDGKGERKITARRNEYYDEVIACLRNPQAILVLGPEAAKAEFRRRISSRHFTGHIAEMKTVAKLTDDQIADYVRQHFQ
jgi:hypothetical protein